jgi:diguanylate cyclase (GGDEF)-like protein
MVLRDKLNEPAFLSNQDGINKLQTEQFHAVYDAIKESFQSLIEQLNEQSPTIEGTLIAFDINGQLVENYSFSDNRVEEIAFFSKGALWNELNMGLNAVSSCMRSSKFESMDQSKHTSKTLLNFDSFALPIFSNSEQIIAYLGLFVHEEYSYQDSEFIIKMIGFSYKACFTMNNERKMNRKLTYHYQKSESEAQKRDILFQAAKSLHSKIDVNSVLSEVFDTMKVVYPSVNIDIFLSQDNHSTSLSVKPLVFDDTEEGLCTRAFMEGKIIHQSEEDGCCIVAAPLSGKQGVYGVFQLHFDKVQYDDSDLKFISMLADSAGTAFENAKLYEQSNLLINELRLINEITRRLNQSLKLQDIFNFASKELINIFNADYGCILKLDLNDDKLIVQASNLPSFSNEIFSLDYGFSGIVYRTKEPVIVSNYSDKHKVKSKLMSTTKSRSLIASPILVGSDVVGVIMVTHRESDFFSYENYKLLQVIAGHIGLAITNASLHAEVRRMVITDNLTTLYSRSYLDEQVNTMQKKDFCGALIMLDIDYFKKINDTFGHQVGDKVLIQVSQIIKSSIRDSDIAARWGGEELAVYLPQSTLEQTLSVAERIRERIFNETDPQVSVSCGIAKWNWEDKIISVESLFFHADMAMYEAKNAGRNQVVVG